MNEFENNEEVTIGHLILMLGELRELTNRLERKIEKLIAYAIAVTIIAIIGWLV